MSSNRVAGKSAKKVDRSTSGGAGPQWEAAENELLKLLAESDRREAETKAKGTRLMEDARRMQGLMYALANVLAFPVRASDEAMIAEWASMWLEVAQHLKLNDCEHLVDQVEAPDDPDYELARSLMRRALAGDSQQQLTRSLVDMFRKPEGGYRNLNLTSFFSLLRDAVQQYWSPPSARPEAKSACEGVAPAVVAAQATTSGAPSKTPARRRRGREKRDPIARVLVERWISKHPELQAWPAEDVARDIGFDLEFVTLLLARVRADRSRKRRSK